MDSIPAIFAVTTDPFLVYTSNVFAILGLRSLYFLLAGVIDRFRYLKLGLALVLVFVGVKMLLTDVYKVPIGLSLAVIAACWGRRSLRSLLFPKAAKRPRPGGARPAAPRADTPGPAIRAPEPEPAGAVGRERGPR